MEILVVDDSKPVLRLVSNALNEIGYRDIYTAESVKLAKAHLENHNIGLIFSDWHMPEMTGIQLATELRQNSINVPFLLCTGYSDQATERNRKGLDILPPLMKPVTRAELADAVFDALKVCNNPSQPS